MADAIRVHGLKELTRDFKKISKDLDKLVTAELTDAAKPVQTKADELALSEIRNMTSSWARMRIGVSRARGVVFMVPASRGRKYKRPNLGGLLMDRAMWPAAEEERDDVVEALGEMIDRLGGKYDLD